MLNGDQTMDAPLEAISPRSAAWRATQWMPASDAAIAHWPSEELQRLEVPVGRRVGALAEVQQEALLRLDLLQEGLRVLRVDVGDAAAPASGKFDRSLVSSTLRTMPR